MPCHVSVRMLPCRKESLQRLCRAAAAAAAAATSQRLCIKGGKLASNTPVGHLLYTSNPSQADEKLEKATCPENKFQSVKDCTFFFVK